MLPTELSGLAAIEVASFFRESRTSVSIIEASNLQLPPYDHPAHPVSPEFQPPAARSPCFRAFRPRVIGSTSSSAAAHLSSTAESRCRSEPDPGTAIGGALPGAGDSNKLRRAE